MAKKKVKAFHVVQIIRLNSFSTKKEAEQFLNLCKDPVEKDTDVQHRIEKNEYFV